MNQAQLGLSEAERIAWARDGYFVRKSAFAGEELKQLRAAADRVARTAAAAASSGDAYFLDGNRFVDVDHHTVQFEHQNGSALVRVVEPVHDLDGVFADLVADPRLVEPMRELVGAQTLGLWTAKLNMKSAEQGSGFGWHQDSPYWIHDSADVDHLPNVFVAFDAAKQSNGALQVVRGSHAKGCLPGRSDGSQLEGFFTDPSLIDTTAIVTPELPAGSLLFFSPHLIHGSQPNQSSNPRRALIATYQVAGCNELKSGRRSAQY